MIKNELLKIFNNLGFDVMELCGVGEVVKMTAEDAFVFSSITGAKYLIYENGVTMKGRCEIFIHRAVFSKGYLIYSPGVFSRNINGKIVEGESAKALKGKYPTVFDSNSKYILIEDIPSGVRSNIEPQVYGNLVAQGVDCNNIVLYKNSLSNNLGESFQEYLASIFFSRSGYITENQAPWFQQNYKYNGGTLPGGIPDFSAFTAPAKALLHKLGLIAENEGIPISLIPVISNFRNTDIDDRRDSNYSYELLIGEAKTNISSLPQAKKQLRKYGAVGLANSLFTIIPNVNTDETYGSFYIDPTFNIRYRQAAAAFIDCKQQDIDSKWLDLYIRLLLLGNVSFDSIVSLINHFRRDNRLPLLDSYESIHLLDAVQNLSNDQFFEYIKGAL